VEATVSFTSLENGWGGANDLDREEEDPDEYPFPLTLRTKRPQGPTSPTEPALPITNGGS
jgi:hypothetical protein